MHFGFRPEHRKQLDGKQLESNKSSIESFATAVSPTRSVGAGSVVRQPPRSTGSHETVGSLLRRLGQPPPDVVEHLTRQFDSVFQSHALRPEDPEASNLDNWWIDDRGELTFKAQGLMQSTKSDRVQSDRVQRTDSAKRDSVGHAGTGGAENQPTAAPSPAAIRFRQQLLAPSRGTRSQPSHEVEQERSVTSFGEVDLIPGRVDVAHLTAAEQRRRDELTRLFREALVERFGADAVDDEPSATANVIRSGKPKTMRVDRRFNWNLVIGVTAALLAAGVVGGGFLISHWRQREEFVVGAHEQASPDPSRRRSAVATSREKPLDDISTTTDRGAGRLSTLDSTLQQQSTNDPVELIPAMEPGLPEDSDDVFERFDDEQEDAGMLDFEDLADPGPQAAEAAVEMEVASDSDQKFGEAKGVEDLASGVPQDQFDQAPESPQQTRTTGTGFVTLPRPHDHAASVAIGLSLERIEAIEFPVDVPIKLTRRESNDGENRGEVELRHAERGVTLARILDQDGATVFRWTPEAKGQAAAVRLADGRLTDRDGNRVYLRPIVEAEPYQLSLDPRERRPSWDLGAAMLTAQTRLKVEWDVPDSIEWAWLNPPESTNPKRAMGTVIFSPAGGESASLGLAFRIDGGRKVSLFQQYYGRLFDGRNWQVCTPGGLQAYSESCAARLQLARKQLSGLQTGISMSSVDRMLFKKQSKQQYEHTIELLETELARCEVLRSLIASVEQQVRLRLEFFVQWPDDQQPVFRMTAAGEGQTGGGEGDAELPDGSGDSDKKTADR
jgi:hypothetical protein